jgi:RNA polymerase sporulation-specific sigma factor
MVKTSKSRTIHKKIKNQTKQKNEFNIIRLSFGIPLENINEDYQSNYSNLEISKRLNLTKTQVENIKK